MSVCVGFAVMSDLVKDCPHEGSAEAGLLLQEAAG